MTMEQRVEGRRFYVITGPSAIPTGCVVKLQKKKT